MPEGTSKTVLWIVGMRDNLCRERVTEALGRAAGVREVQVSLIRARAVVVHGAACDAAMLIREVEKAGYGAMVGGA